MLELSGLNAFYKESHILKDVSLVVNDKEIVVIMGPNGHGKSTLLQSVCGLVKKVRGRILFDGQDVLGLGTKKLVNRGLVYIAEERELFREMTVLENLKLGAYCKSARPHEKNNLEYVFSLFPRLAERKNQLAATMSGGEGKMLAIARGLMSNARFLAIDEPSLGLQPSLRSEVARIIRKINEQGITVLVVEQNIPQITALADRIYLLEEGHITFGGTREEALSDKHLQELFLGGVVD